MNKTYPPLKEQSLSDYYGVVWFRKLKKWFAYIVDENNKKIIKLGPFRKEKEAALAYNKKAKELLGKDAKLNVIK